ncbi:MAG: hypothetical protein ACKVN9_04185 [Methylophilaceae bacterium]
MRLFSYVVARDYGFAPNPFFGTCTLATCKPDIRQFAAVGDWVVGLSSTKDRKILGLIYVMRVDEILTYDTYWHAPRFENKKPSRSGSVKQLFGDNIYHRNAEDQWFQVDSHHSLADGSPNLRNINNDTKSEGVLISNRFAYWGSNAINVPQQFLDFNGHTLRVKRGYKVHFPENFVHEFVTWFESLNLQGYLGSPYMWQRERSDWSHPTN